jgi:hypothetical protein
VALHWLIGTALLQRQCLASLRLGGDRFLALPWRVASDCEPCNNLDDGDIADSVMLCAGVHAIAHRLESNVH